MNLERFIEKNVPIDELMEHLIAGNKRYRSLNSHLFTHLQDSQKPDICLVTCSDSRIPPDLFGLDSLNEIFTIRNIGNQYATSEGSIKFAIVHLHTPLLVIMGHTGCGAISAALANNQNENPAILKEVRGLVELVREGGSVKLAGGVDDTPILQNSMYGELNVDFQIKGIISDPLTKTMVTDGLLTIVGMMFDIHQIYGVSQAQFHVVNINGERDKDRIKQHKLLSKLNTYDKDLIVRRLAD